jgi:hypothetical protein
MSLGGANVQSAATNKFPGKLLFQDGKLTAQITGVPLRRVMDEISRLTGAQVRWLGSVAEGPVTVAFANAAVSRALRLILGEQNFLLLYSSEGAKLSQIWISSARQGNGQFTQASLSQVSATPVGELQRTALHSQSLPTCVQAVEQLKGYARTDTRAKTALSRIVRAADNVFVRQAAARALMEIP